MAHFNESFDSGDRFEVEITFAGISQIFRELLRSQAFFDVNLIFFGLSGGSLLSLPLGKRPNMAIRKREVSPSCEDYI